MKIHLRLAILFLLLSFFVAPASAADTGEQYEVRKGDTLSEIARRYSGVTWEAIQKANDIKNPHLIYPKQKLRIPTKKAGTRPSVERGSTEVSRPNVRPKAEVKSETQTCNEEEAVFLWREVGANPCTDCPLERSLSGLGYPEEVAKALIEKVENGEYTLGVIRKDDHFLGMYFGKGILRCNVVAAWKDGRDQPAKIYAVEHEGMRWELLYPLLCHNWTKRTFKLPPPPTVKPPDEPVAELPPTSPETTPRPPVTVIPKEPCDCPELITLAVFEPLQGDAPNKRNSPFPEEYVQTGD